MSVKISVLLPCWLIDQRLVTLTEEAIRSIRVAGDINLIIIDNGSTMAGGLLRELSDIYIRNKENLGYARAVNQGLKLVDKDAIVCISNNDVRPSKNWKEVALSILEDKNIGSVHYRMIKYDCPFNPGNEMWTNLERWCTSSFFVMRNKQLYDENFFNSYEDWDYWKRFRELGYKTAYTNRAEYQHMDSFTQQFIPERESNNDMNREYFKKKHGEYPEKIWWDTYPDQMKLDYYSNFK